MFEFYFRYIKIHRNNYLNTKYCSKKDTSIRKKFVSPHDTCDDKHIFNGNFNIKKIWTYVNLLPKNGTSMVWKLSCILYRGWSN